jgi:hypothetical protein
LPPFAGDGIDLTDVIGTAVSSLICFLEPLADLLFRFEFEGMKLSIRKRGFNWPQAKARPIGVCLAWFRNSLSTE